MPKAMESFWRFVRIGETGCGLNFRKVILEWIKEDHTEDRKTSKEATGVIQMKRKEDLN